LKINIFNQSSLSINKKKITKLVNKVLKEESFKLKKLNVIIADNNYLRMLNQMFFKKNRPTNVISFNMDEVFEIYVSGDKVRYEDELYYFILHGLLHIIGYDHKNREEEKFMEKRCLKYIELYLRS
jgi:probable rRNA maturation factor